MGNAAEWLRGLDFSGGSVGRDFEGGPLASLLMATMFAPILCVQLINS